MIPKRSEPPRYRQATFQGGYMAHKHIKLYENNSNNSTDLGFLSASFFGAIHKAIQEGYRVSFLKSNKQGLVMTKKTYNVLKMLINGELISDIAEDMHVSDNAIREILHRARKRFNVHTNYQLIYKLSRYLD